ncbi:MAG: TerC/Alx family metal homeostasis membrane protein [Deltaproteobacteria bacterium]|jgi:tellurite resistance protein TerC|nr:TerC/Alx family metal homeostasis membrane protein [Deltaproteobacteria bacterium]
MLGEFTITEILVFLVLVAVSMVIDLKAHKQDVAVCVKSATLWSIGWIMLALFFGVYIWLQHGVEDASLYLTGYLLEKALSMDNLFVIMAIFTSFQIADKYQHRVLYYGILGALVLRFIFVALGAGLIELGGKIVLGIFGFLVLWSAIKMWQISRSLKTAIEIDYTKHFVVRLTSKIFPVYPKIENHNFFVKTANSANYAVTPLFLCLIIIEFADLMFAIDSVPAIFAVTEKPFLVYTSNIFAILGIRSLFFLLAAAKRYLCHLEKSVIVILAFIGLKMLFEVFNIIHVTDKAFAALISLGIVMSLLMLGILASVIFPVKK